MHDDYHIAIRDRFMLHKGSCRKSLDQLDPWTPLGHQPAPWCPVSWSCSSVIYLRGIL